MLPAALATAQAASPVAPDPPPPEHDALARRWCGQVRGLLGKGLDGMVTVYCSRGNRQVTSGTGLVVGADALVAIHRRLLAHKGLSGVHVQAGNDDPVRAGVVAMDPKTHLAILRPATPLSRVRPLSGRKVTAADKGHLAFALGRPAAPRLGFAVGAIGGVYSAAALREVAPKQVPAAHAYQYVETDADVDWAAAGGALLDANGNALGVCSLRLPDSRMAFALEWRAVEDLARQAASAAPMPLERVRQAALAGEAAAPTFAPAASSHALRKAVQEHRACMYCPRCGGRGSVTVMRSKPKRVRRPFTAQVGKHFVTKYRTVTVTTKVRVPVMCPKCRRRRINPGAAETFAGLCAIAGPMLTLDQNAYGAAGAWWEASDTLDHAALNDDHYIAALGRLAASPLAEPGKHIGKPVAFIGIVQTIEKAGDVISCHASAHVPPVVVVFRGVCPVLEKTPCLVAGVIRGANGPTACVLATGMYALHDADPAYKPPRPLAATARPLLAPTTRRAAAGRPAARLRAAKMFLAGGLNDKARQVLRDIVRKHPASAEARQAEDLLLEIGDKDE